MPSCEVLQKDGLSKEEILDFKQQGYIVLRKAILPELWHEALRAINHRMGQPNHRHEHKRELVKSPNDFKLNWLISVPRVWAAIHSLINSSKAAQPRVSGPVLSGSKEPSEAAGDRDKQEILPGPPDLHNMSGRMPVPVALLLAMSPVFTASLRLKPVSRSPRGFQHPSWLSQCKSVYLDVGSNIGVQVMKLFEPEWFPGADILGLFEEKFGHPKDRREKGERSGICALGFEPNPIHRAQLDKVQRDYQKKGWYVHFYPFAVGGTDSIVNFTVTESSRYEDWGARVVPEPQPKQPTMLTSVAASLVTEQPPQTQD